MAMPYRLMSVSYTHLDVYKRQELNRELLAGMLEDEYEIYQVENGKKAIDILEENREQFKLVLLDINMPVMDGYEVLSIMKRRKWLDKLPVIVISAEISGESVKKAYELGASDYFVRPFNVAIVLDVYKRQHLRLGDSDRRIW